VTALDDTAALLRALERPCPPAEAASSAGLSPLRVAGLLTQLYAERRISAYCHDHFLRRELLARFEDGPVQPSWSRNRRVMAALRRDFCSLEDLVERSGLAARQVATELSALISLGACRTVRLSSDRRGWSRVDGARDRRVSRAAVSVVLAQGLIVANLAQPMRQSDLSTVMGWSTVRMGWWLRTLITRGRVVTQSRGTFVAAPVGPNEVDHPAHDGPVDPTVRLQPVRDSIMAFLLAEPRQAVEIASAVGRSVPCVTGHLRAMQARGLVARIGYGRYARSDMPGLPPLAERDFRRPSAPQLASSRPLRLADDAPASPTARAAVEG